MLKTAEKIQNLDTSFQIKIYNFCQIKAAAIKKKNYISFQESILYNQTQDRHPEKVHKYYAADKKPMGNQDLNFESYTAKETTNTTAT